MKLSVAYQGGTRYDILSDRHRVVTDRPMEEGGADAGMTSCGTVRGLSGELCGLFIGQFCARHDISREGLRGGGRVDHGGRAASGRADSACRFVSRTVWRPSRESGC